MRHRWAAASTDDARGQNLARWAARLMWDWLRWRLTRLMGTQSHRSFIRRPRGPGGVPSAWLEGLCREPHTRGLLGRIRQRELAYRLYLPNRDAPTTKMPLMVLLHGCTQDAQSFAAGTRMNAMAESRCFAALYPEQSRKANSS